MSRLLSTVTGTTGETEPSRGTEQHRETTGRGGGGSRRRLLGVAAAGLGTAYLLRRRRARKRRRESADDTQTTAGDSGASAAADETRGRRLGGRLTRAVVGVAASVAVRRAVRRWRKR